MTQRIILRRRPSAVRVRKPPIRRHMESTQSRALSFLRALWLSTLGHNEGQNYGVYVAGVMQLLSLGWVCCF